MREYMLRRYYDRKAQAHERLGGECVRCGATSDLQMDHIDRSTKSFEISKLWSVSKARYDAEVAKCQLLCRPCHRKKSLEAGVVMFHRQLLAELLLGIAVGVVVLRAWMRIPSTTNNVAPV